MEGGFWCCVLCGIACFCCIHACRTGQCKCEMHPQCTAWCDTCKKGCGDCCDKGKGDNENDGDADGGDCDCDCDCNCTIF